MWNLGESHPVMISLARSPLAIENASLLFLCHAQGLTGVVVTLKSLIAIHSDCELPYYRVALITNKMTSLRPFLSHPVRLLVNNSGLYIEYVDLLKGSVVAFRIPLTSLYAR